MPKHFSDQHEQFSDQHEQFVPSSWTLSAVPSVLCPGAAPLFPVPAVGGAEPKTKLAMMECNHPQCPVLVTFISVISDNDDCSLSGADSHCESFVPGVFISNEEVTTIGMEDETISNAFKMLHRKFAHSHKLNAVLRQRRQTKAAPLKHL